jgi:hypothetical protein
MPGFLLLRWLKALSLTCTVLALGQPGALAQGSDKSTNLLQGGSGRQTVAQAEQVGRSRAAGETEASRLMDEFGKADQAGQRRLLPALVASLTEIFRPQTRNDLLKRFPRQLPQSVVADLISLCRVNPKEIGYMRHRRPETAICMLGVVGTGSKQVVPALISFLDVRELQEATARTLADLGPAAAPAADKLAELLKTDDGRVRCSAAAALAGIGPQAAKFIPQMKESAYTYSFAGNPREIVESVRLLGGTVDNDELARRLAGSRAEARERRKEQANRQRQAVEHDRELSESRRQASERQKKERSELFETIVARAMVDETWQDSYASQMEVHQIRPAEIHAEVHKRKLMKLPH